MLTAFAAVLANLVQPKYTVGSVLNVVLLGFGAYLMIRHSNATGKRAAIQRRQRATARRSAKADSRSGAAARRGTTPARSTAPTRSKRYTPPKKSAKRR